MSKRSFITNITPLPATVSRDVAVAMLHDHHGMIELNPLVLRHDTTQPPPNATPEEAEHAIWYEITDRINYLPGGAVKGEVSYKACFYNLPLGLQTHVFAPAGVDIRSKWSVGGNMPGEPREPTELGMSVPRDCLYFKEEVDLRCSVLMSNFVRRNLKKSHAEVAEKITERAVWMCSITNGSTVTSPERSTLQSTTTTTSHHSPVAHHPAVYYSYPPYCACEGTSHTPPCSLSNSEDARSTSNFHKQKPCSTNPLQFHSSYSQPSSAASSPQLESPYSELYGSPSVNSCMCTGALHQEGCISYPGLRHPQSRAWP